MFQSTSTTPPTTETTYIINQNEKLQKDCNELREQISKMQVSYKSDLEDIRTEKDTFEDELDKSESSLRYLRNLQKTLSSLHQESKIITDEYKQIYKTELKAHKQTYNSFYSMRMTFYMILCSYIVTLLTFLFSSMFDNVVIVCTTTSFGMVGVCKFILKCNNLFSLNNTEPKSEKLSPSLIQKEFEYKKGVDGLPGITDLIDNI